MGSMTRAGTLGLSSWVCPTTRRHLQSLPFGSGGFRSVRSTIQVSPLRSRVAASGMPEIHRIKEPPFPDEHLSSGKGGFFDEQKQGSEGRGS